MEVAYRKATPEIKEALRFKRADWVTRRANAEDADDSVGLWMSSLNLDRLTESNRRCGPLGRFLYTVPCAKHDPKKLKV